MQCPNPACGPSHPNLLMTDREGVEIDYCPQCRGVWLDRGELDKLIALAAKASAASDRNDDHNRSDSYRPEPYRPETSRHEGRREHEHSYKHSHAYSHKRKSWLGDMFDFD